MCMSESAVDALTPPSCIPMDRHGFIKTTHTALPTQSVARTASVPADTGLRESHGMPGP